MMGNDRQKVVLVNDLDIMETLIGEAKAGTLELSVLIDTFLGLTVALPSQSEPADGGVTPIFADIEGVPYMVVASSTEALRKTSALAGYAVTMSGAAVVTGVAAGLGLVVNSVHDSISFSPEILGDLRAGVAGGTESSALV